MANETISNEKCMDEFSRNGDVNVSWSVRLCDLTPFDYFYWGYVKRHIKYEIICVIDRTTIVSKF